MSRDVDDALRLILRRHEAMVVDDPCLAWGMMAHQEDPEPCVDCELDAHMVHSSGVSLCWRCAFWRHMAWCPQAEALAGTDETPAA